MSLKNFVVFVPGTKQGDIVKIRIKEIRGSHAVGEVIGAGEAEPAESEAEEGGAEPSEADENNGQESSEEVTEQNIEGEKGEAV